MAVVGGQVRVRNRVWLGSDRSGQPRTRSLGGRDTVGCGGVLCRYCRNRGAADRYRRRVRPLRGDGLKPDGVDGLQRSMHACHVNGLVEVLLFRSGALTVLVALDGSTHGGIADPIVGAVTCALEVLPRGFVWPRRSAAALFGLGVATGAPQEE